MDNALQWLECGICYEIMTEPRTLPCGHTFCRKCLQQLIDQAGNLKCSLDKRMFIVPGGDAGQLMRNYQLEDAIESARSSAKFGVKSIPCSQHKNKSARLICNSCDIPFCLECIETHADHGILRSVNCTVKTEQQQPLNAIQQQLGAARRVEVTLESTNSEREIADEFEVKVFKIDGNDFSKPSDDIRRFQLKLTTNCFQNLNKKLESEYATSDVPQVFWKDSDGDFVKIASDDGLKVAARKSPAPFRVYARFNSQPSSSGSASRPTTASSTLKSAPAVGAAGLDSNGFMGEVMNASTELSMVLTTGDETASNGPVHFGVKCDGCGGRVCGIRYKCRVCPDFDFCQSCQATRAHAHPMHPINSPQSVPSSRNSIARGRALIRITCDECKCNVYGVRYNCTICDNYDLCELCQQQNKHSFHPMRVINA